ncbi:MAG: hypothetical protein RLO18_09510, partial [Gimesia chilikensis]
FLLWLLNPPGSVIKKTTTFLNNYPLKKNPKNHDSETIVLPRADGTRGKPGGGTAGRDRSQFPGDSPG